MGRGAANFAVLYHQRRPMTTNAPLIPACSPSKAALAGHLPALRRPILYLRALHIIQIPLGIRFLEEFAAVLNILRKRISLLEEQIDLSQLRLMFLGRACALEYLINLPVPIQRWHGFVIRRLQDSLVFHWSHFHDNYIFLPFIFLLFDRFR